MNQKQQMKQLNQQQIQKVSGTAPLEPCGAETPDTSLLSSPDCHPSSHQSPQQGHKLPVHLRKRPSMPRLPAPHPAVRSGCNSPQNYLHPNLRLQQANLIQQMSGVPFCHTMWVSGVSSEGGVRQSVLGQPLIGSPVRDLGVNFAPGHYLHPCGSHIHVDRPVKIPNERRENLLHIAGKSSGPMRRSSTNSDVGKGTAGPIHSSVPEQAEHRFKKPRGQRSHELEEEFANAEKIQQPPEANSANISDREEDENAAVQPEDDGVDRNRAAEGVGTCLKVTIQRSSESRAFSTAPDQTTAGAAHDRERENSKPTAKFTCYICNVTCPDQQGFQTHMISLNHQQRMMEIQRAGNNCLAALLPQSRGSLEATNRERKAGRQRWCPICQCHFSGDLIEHKRTTKHKRTVCFQHCGNQVLPTLWKLVNQDVQQAHMGVLKLRMLILAKVSSRPFCTLCERHFRTPRKFVEHMKSPEHKQRVEELRDDDGPEVMEELITVDAVGCFEGEDDYEEDRNEEEVSVCEKHPAHKEIILEETTNHEVYDPDTQYGTGFVVPVAGFLCKLCHKFYHFESSALETHCRSFIHFQNLQKYNTLKMQKKASHEDIESDASCNSLIMDPQELELSAGFSNETEISDSTQSGLGTSHVLHSRKNKRSRKHHKSKTPYSKCSVAPQNSTVACIPHFGSGSNQESYIQKGMESASGVQRQCSESCEKLKCLHDLNYCSAEHKDVSTTLTHSLCHVSQLNSEESVGEATEFKKTVRTVRKT